MKDSKGELEETPFELTVFRNLYDNKTNKTLLFGSLTSFESFFVNCFENQSFERKEEAKLFSPAMYRKGDTRKNDNVQYYGRWFAMDIDSFSSSSSDIENVNDAERVIRSELFPKGSELLNYRFFCYSTASARKDKIKFRLVFPLSSVVQKSNLRPFWFAMNIEMNKMIDRQTKDISRMFYTPGHYQDAFNFFWINDKESLMNPEKIIDKHTSIDENFLLNCQSREGTTYIDRLPDAIANEVKKFRKNKLENNKIEYTWSDFNNCPFVHRDALDEYRAIVYNRATGRYHGLYRLMVSIASIAVKKGYPISSFELENLVREIDNSIDGYYKKRKISVEVDRALEFVYSNNTF